MWHTTIYLTPESAKVVSLGKVIFGTESKFKHSSPWIHPAELHEIATLRKQKTKTTFKHILENLEPEKEFDY